MTKFNSLLAGSLLILTSVVVSLVLGEILVRSTGRTPIIVPEKLSNEPVMHMYHKEYGWINKPGKYLVPGYTPGAKDITVTFNKDHSRNTGNNKRSEKFYVFLGGSYTQGWAVSDGETFSSVIQKKKPNIKIINHGVGGYGTYQSYLLMKDIVPNYPDKTTFIYYLLDHHEDRNVATTAWLRGLSRFSKRGHIETPFVSLINSEEVMHHDPEKYFTLPFRNKSALTAFIERVIMKIKTRNRGEYKVEATLNIIKNMHKMAHEYHMDYKVIIIMHNKETVDRYKNYFNTNNIVYKDCRLELTDDLKVNGEGHPNATAHNIWASCVSPIIK